MLICGLAVDIYIYIHRGLNIEKENANGTKCELSVTLSKGSMRVYCVLATRVRACNSSNKSPGKVSFWLRI